jgi:hypothetical protein
VLRGVWGTGGGAQFVEEGMFIYHYHAGRHLEGGGILHDKGVLDCKHKITDTERYLAGKARIAERFGERDLKRISVFDLALVEQG